MSKTYADQMRDPSIDTGPAITKTLPNSFDAAMKNYQQAMKRHLNNSINTTQPYISTPPEVAIKMVDYTIWVVTKVDGEGNGYVRAVFSAEKEADLFAASVDCDSYEYMDISPFTLDQEVPKDDVDKAE